MEPIYDVDSLDRDDSDLDIFSDDDGNFVTVGQSFEDFRNAKQ